ncbi:MAG: tetratricopeptide repeat protein, partial [Deltaproteobacteria bacterium]|nr:tetratricopeptide repeat protein [Deltaproteobacteria bacterium]
MTQAAHEFIQRARGLIGRRQYQEAVKVCRLGLLSHPTLVEGRIVLASALLELGRHDEVLAEMRVALDLAADSPHAHILKGEAFLRKGDLKQAEEALLAARKLDPKNDRIAQLIAEVRRGGLRPPAGAHGRVVSSGGADDFAVGGVATRVYPATGKLLQDPVEDYENAAATMVGTEPPTGFVDVDPALLEATRVGDDAEATRVGDEATVQVSPELAADLLLESEVGLDSLDLGTPSIGTAQVTESAQAAARRRAHDDPTRAIGTAAPARPSRARTPQPEPDDMDPEIDPPEADDLESGGIELDPDDSAVQMLDGGDLSARSKLPLRPRNEKETQKARPGGREAASGGKQAPPRLGRGAAFADGSDETRPETAQAKAQPKVVKLSSPAKGAPGQHIRALLEDDSDVGQELESTTPQGIDLRKQARPGGVGGGVRREVPPSAIAAERSVAEAEAKAEAAERAAAERAAAERAAAER